MLKQYCAVQQWTAKGCEQSVGVHTCPIH